MLNIYCFFSLFSFFFPSTAKEAPKKKKGKELPPAQVIITSEQRKGKRSITVVTGLAAFGIKLADAGKAFSKKFACGASPDKTKDEIVIQGDIQDELEEFILEIYAVRSTQTDCWPLSYLL
jgi:density-regulated protein DRP1